MSRSCPKCQNELAADADECQKCDQEFCPECLTPLPPMTAECPACGLEFELVCPECEAIIEEWMDECEACGCDLDFGEKAQKNSLASGPLSAAFGGGVPTVAAPEPDKKEAGEKPEMECPACEEDIFETDGFCRHCGQLFCGHCRAAVAEDDEVCSQCHTALYFNCPACEFELNAGTDICPNCNVLIPNFCTHCSQAVQPENKSCGNCEEPVTLLERKGAATAHIIATTVGHMRILSCPQCGEKFTQLESACKKCDFRLCLTCQIDLLSSEEHCPRCGKSPEQILQALAKNAGIELATESTCPKCEKPVNLEEGECAACGTLLCPKCSGLLAGDEDVCPQCGTEFELLCPECGGEIKGSDVKCRHCGVEFE